MGTLSGTDGLTDLILPHQVAPSPSGLPRALSLLSLSQSAIFFFCNQKGQISFLYESLLPTFMEIISIVWRSFLSILLTSSWLTLLMKMFMLV